MSQHNPAYLQCIDAPLCTCWLAMSIIKPDEYDGIEGAIATGVTVNEARFYLNSYRFTAVKDERFLRLKLSIATDDTDTVIRALNYKHIETPFDFFSVLLWSSQIATCRVGIYTFLLHATPQQLQLCVDLNNKHVVSPYLHETTRQQLITFLTAFLRTSDVWLVKKLDAVCQHRSTRVPFDRISCFYTIVLNLAVPTLSS